MNWRAILAAPASRETQNLRGIFPRIVSSNLSQIFTPFVCTVLQKPKQTSSSLELDAEKRKAEEADNLEGRQRNRIDGVGQDSLGRGKVDKKREEEKKEKEIAMLIKQDQQPRRKKFDPNRKPTAEEVKKRERDEKARQEEEAREQKRRAAIEKTRIAEEVAVFNEKLMRVRRAFSRANSSIVNTLRLADSNGDGTLSLKEFMTALSRENVSINADDLLYVYDFIDEDKDGRLQYKELADFLQNKRQVDAAAHITKKR